MRLTVALLMALMVASVSAWGEEAALVMRGRMAVHQEEGDLQAMMVLTLTNRGKAPYSTTPGHPLTLDLPPKARMVYLTVEGTSLAGRIKAGHVLVDGLWPVGDTEVGITMVLDEDSHGTMVSFRASLPVEELQVVLDDAVGARVARSTVEDLTRVTMEPQGFYAGTLRDQEAGATMEIFLAPRARLGWLGPVPWPVAEAAAALLAALMTALVVRRRQSEQRCLQRLRAIERASLTHPQAFAAEREALLDRLVGIRQGKNRDDG